VSAAIMPEKLPKLIRDWKTESTLKRLCIRLV
jgi:hypothetical protein